MFAHEQQLPVVEEVVFLEKTMGLKANEYNTHELVEKMAKSQLLTN